MLRPDYQYVNLEDLTVREYASNDPKGFLETYQNGVILDEIQHVPELFSYLQVYTDQRQRNGEYIITGSQKFLMMEKISQSLAGRVALFNLLPFSLQELQQSEFTISLWEDYMLAGSYPRKWIQQIKPTEYYENYLRTYIERDVRLIKNITNLRLFQKFIMLLAGRVGQLFNQNNLGNELGIDNKTVESWMTLLEVSFIAFRLQPYYKNFNKRIVKTPKVYFYDTGLLCTLLNIRTVNELNIHFAKGPLFENLVILEMLKNKYNQSVNGNFYFWREHSGSEIDLILEQGPNLKAIEIKSGKTVNPDFFKSLNTFSGLDNFTECYLIYGGNEIQNRSNATVLGIFDMDKIK
jgi:predicted AAA+ superfamily ATPase